MTPTTAGKPALAVTLESRISEQAVDLARIEELIELMRRSGVTQLSLELPDCKVSITRAAEAEPEAGAPAAPRPAEVIASSTADPIAVTSPVVGLFRRGGPKGRGPVAVGDRVAPGMPLAIIEAMKVPNEVRSPVAGVVSAVLVEDGAAVEYGQPLFTVRPEEGGDTDESETAVGLA